MSLIPTEPFIPPKSKRRPRKGRVFPPPARSGRLYVTLDPSTVHMFRFLLEAQDNLGIMTVVDRWRAALLIRFSPHQEKEIRAFLEGMKQTLPFEGPFLLSICQSGSGEDGDSFSTPTPELTSQR